MSFEVITDNVKIILGDIAPTGVTEEVSNAIIASGALVEYLLYKADDFNITKLDNGCVSIVCEANDETALKKVNTSLIDNNALFCLTTIDTTNTTHFFTAIFELGPNAELLSHSAKMRDTLDESPPSNKSDYDISRYVLALVEIGCCLKELSKEASIWYTERLDSDEIRGPHILALQNFMYRRIKQIHHT